MPIHNFVLLFMRKAVTRLPRVPSRCASKLCPCMYSSLVCAAPLVTTAFHSILSSPVLPGPLLRFAEQIRVISFHAVSESQFHPSRAVLWCRSINRIRVDLTRVLFSILASSASPQPRKARAHFSTKTDCSFRNATNERPPARIGSAFPATRRARRRGRGRAVVKMTSTGSTFQ